MQYCVHGIDLKSYLNVSLYLLYLMGMYFSRTQYKNSMQKFTSSFFDFYFFADLSRLSSGASQ